MRDISFRNPSPGYKWSQDYNLLLSAMVDGAIVALVLYDTFQDGRKIFDVCMMMRKPISEKHVEFVASVRGIEYFGAYSGDEFVKLCKKYEVRFMDPAENARLRSALAPLLSHAEAHDYAPPIRMSVRQCREIKEKVNGI